jgi:hypothetical protein
MQGKKALLKGLEELAAQLNIRVRYEKTSARGGLCKHDEQYYIIIDRKASEDLKIDILARELRNFDLSDIFLSPRIRELLAEG